jgi:flagellar basal-body rod protein FlgB
MPDRISDYLHFSQQSLNLRAQRQEVLSANIANADTPNFKARDFDFAKELKDAMGPTMRLPFTQLTLTSSRHIPVQASSPGPTALLYRNPFQPSLDGNTVDMDAERAQFADNTMRYQSSVAVLSNRIKTLTAAMQD